MKKILFFDVETTGLDPKVNSIVQLSGMLEIDGKIVSEFNFNMAPDYNDPIEDSALAVIGKTREELMQYPPVNEVYRQFTGVLNRFIDKYERSDKFYPAGYNVRFDLEFLSEFFKRNNDVYFGSWCNWRAIDAMQIAHIYDYKGKLNLLNYKLETLCNHYGINLLAHDAMSDIKATRHLLYKFLEELNI